MTRTYCGWITLCLAAVTTLALAQDASPAELRREIEALRAEVELLNQEREDLEREIRSLSDESHRLRDALHEAQNQIATLKEQLEANRRIAPADRDTPATPQPADTPSESTPQTQQSSPQVEIPLQPLSSPESMRLALERSHRETFQNLNLTSDNARLEYRRRLDQWIPAVKRTMRGQTRWRAIISDVATHQTDRTTSARMQVVHWDSFLPIGPSFIMTVPQRMTSRVTPGGPPELWEITLSVMPDPIINEHRLEPGPFNYPELIGPMVEFNFTMEWIGMRKINPDNPNTPPATEGDAP